MTTNTTRQTLKRTSTTSGPPAALGFAALAVALWTGLTTGDHSDLGRSR